jgi:hypothetical protein
MTEFEFVFVELEIATHIIEPKVSFAGSSSSLRIYFQEFELMIKVPFVLMKTKLSFLLPVLLISL